VLENDGQDPFGQSCEELSISQSQGGKQHSACNKKKGRLSELVTSYVAAVFRNSWLKER